VRGSSDAATAAITARCGEMIGKRQAEQLVVAGAAGIDAFYAGQIPLPRAADELLVISVDGKGIVMRPGALRQAAARHTNMRPLTSHVCPTLAQTGLALEPELR
jgi:hypothetical protein